MGWNPEGWQADGWQPPGWQPSGDTAAPTFNGPAIAGLLLIEGVAMAARDFSSLFISSEAMAFAADGALPAGVSMLADGRMVGTPRARGTFEAVSITAHTESGSAESNEFTIRVVARTRRANRFAFGKFSRRIS